MFAVLFFDEFPGFAFSKTRDSEFDLDSQHFLYRHTTITKSSNGNEQWRWTGLLSIKRFRRTHSGGMVSLTVEPSNGNSKRLYIHVPVSELLDAIERDTHKRKKPTATSLSFGQSNKVPEKPRTNKTDTR